MPPPSAEALVRVPTGSRVGWSELAVNPASSASATAIAGWIKKSTWLPDWFRLNVGADAGSSSVALPAITFPRGAPSKQEWLQDVARVGGQWEVTDGTLIIQMAKNGALITQKLQPNIGGGNFTGGMQEQVGIRTMIMNSQTRREEPVWIERDFEGASAPGLPHVPLSPSAGLVLAKTVPNPRMGNPDDVERASLASGRGLIIVAKEVKIQRGVEAESLPVDVPIAVRSRNLIHELAAHAGILAQGQRASHADPASSPQTGRNTNDLDSLFDVETTPEWQSFRKKLDLAERSLRPRTR